MSCSMPRAMKSLSRPDPVVGPVYGLRAWSVLRSGLLTSTTFIDSVWEPGSWTEAGAHRSVFDYEHAAPSAGCDCGIHALKSERRLRSMFAEIGGTVLGQVELAGRVVEHDAGYRAERARVSGIFHWSPPHVDASARGRILLRARRAAERYAVPLLAFERM